MSLCFMVCMPVHVQLLKDSATCSKLGCRILLYVNFVYMQTSLVMEQMYGCPSINVTTCVSFTQHFLLCPDLLHCAGVAALHHSRSECCVSAHWTISVLDIPPKPKCNTTIHPKVHPRPLQELERLVQISCQFLMCNSESSILQALHAFTLAVASHLAHPLQQMQLLLPSPMLLPVYVNAQCIFFLIKHLFL